MDWIRKAFIFATLISLVLAVVAHSLSAQPMAEACGVTAFFLFLFAALLPLGARER